VYPSYSPFTTPAYTDTGFQILGYALESIKGKSFKSLVEDSILSPLGMSHTFYNNPADDAAIIPGGNKSAAGWAYQLGDEEP
jgi:CubicO group peptidase (beta-lactamase class C family)